MRVKKTTTKTSFGRRTEDVLTHFKICIQ